MAQERYFLQLEFTLAKFCIQFMLSQPRQDNPQMLYMICLILKVNQDIIDRTTNLSSSSMNTEFIKYMK